MREVLMLIVLSVACCYAADGNGLSFDFYERSCPQVEMMVTQGLQAVFLSDPTKPAALLRLLFHDCQVQGCDASILLDGNGGGNMTSEMASGRNFGIRGREAIDMIKSMIEIACPLTVSCADIIALAAREAVAASGGPYIRVPLGRRDAFSSSYRLADFSLPSADTGVDGMLQIFATKGMTVEESVAILGAHTIGITHCINIIDQLNKPESDYSRLTESRMRLFLKFSCPKEIQAAKSLFVGNDLTNFAFDNQFYRDTLGGRGVLRIDSEMAVDPRTASIVEQFAIDQAYFFQSFSSAFVKLSSHGVLTGNQGGMRQSCSRIG